jgi:small subunit ribosomal protein S9
MATQEKVYYATGRRKTSTSRIFLKSGSGKVLVNGLTIGDYLKRLTSQMIALQPLDLVSLKNKLDLNISVSGGGESGQAGAICHGISRALTIYDEQLRGVLKKAGFLTRDSRMVERKKYGKSGARARYQHSKR